MKVARLAARSWYTPRGSIACLSILLVPARKSRPHAALGFMIAASISAIFLALATAAFGYICCDQARMLFSMGRYEFVHRSMGAVHKHYQTPHLAVSASCLFTIIVVLICSHTAPLNAFGYTATFGTFGFLAVYLLTCVVAPVELWRAGELTLGKLMAGILGAGLMAFVLVGSLVPVPPYPYALLPYMFLAYLTLGGVWYGIVSVRFPHAREGLELDLET